jgi:pilus assembly protein CpaD
MSLAKSNIARYGNAGARILLGFGLLAPLAACNTTAKDVSAAAAPTDYRLRHPVVFREDHKSLALLVGPGRGGLSETQRTEVVAFARNWRQEASGGIIVERPAGGPNSRAVADTLKEVMSIFASAGIPQAGIGVRPYSSNGNPIAPLRLHYPQIVAGAGPCGTWPDDLGPSNDPKHFENAPYYNLGCATQNNLAAMTANPADLIQPRAETPAYTAKRAVAMDKWRKGESPSTTYTDSEKGAVSDVGK